MLKIILDMDCVAKEIRSQIQGSPGQARVVSAEFDQAVLGLKPPCLKAPSYPGTVRLQPGGSNVALA